MRSPGIEPGSITWQATIITTRPRTLLVKIYLQNTSRGCKNWTCSMRGSNPRPLAHKTNTLPTELMEHSHSLWWYSVVVSISGCDPLDPGSNPGTAMIFCWM